MSTGQVNFSCYSLNIRILTGSNEVNAMLNKIKNMHPQKQVIALGILILFINIISIVFENTKLFYLFAGYFTVTVGYMIAFFYFTLQILFLYKTIKSESIFIYFFPIHWAIEIWRILSRIIPLVPYRYWRSDFLKFFYAYLTAIFWQVDKFPCDIFHTLEVLWPGKLILTDITIDDVVKLVIAIIAFIIAVIYSWKKFHIGSKEATDRTA